MDKLTIKIDAKDTIANLKKIIEAHPRAIARALNDMARQGMNESIRLIQDKYILKSTSRKYFEIARASAKNLIAKIFVKKRSGKYAIGLVYFKHSPSKLSGISIEVLKGKSSRLRHAFKATMPSGHKGIWVRDITKPKVVPKRGRYAKTKIKRQPIKELFGLSIFSMFKGANVMDPLKKFIVTKLPILIQRYVDKEIKGYIK